MDRQPTGGTVRRRRWDSRTRRPRYLRPTLRCGAWPLFAVLALSFAASGSRAADERAPSAPTDLQVVPCFLDGAGTLRLEFALSVDDDAARPLVYTVQRASEDGGLFADVLKYEADPETRRRGKRARVVMGNLPKEKPFWFRISSRRRPPAPQEGAAGGEAAAGSATLADMPRSAWTEFGPARVPAWWIDGGRLWFGAATAGTCTAILALVLVARSGRDMRIRKIAGLEVIDEAVGRATEMGKSCLFVPGIQDINDIQTIAGLTVLSRVAEVSAEYGARVQVPTSRALVMTAGRETVQAAFLTAGRPDAYREDDVYYVTDEQFGYVAYVTGLMVREKPAACFFMGAFFAESLILAETGNSIGAIQVAGTAMASQLPFFVASCDYTLIGEEFFAASAYLSKDPDQLGSLKGQDLAKVLGALVLIGGCLLATAGSLASRFAGEGSSAADGLRDALRFLLDTVLK